MKLLFSCLNAEDELCIIHTAAELTGLSGLVLGSVHTPHLSVVTDTQDMPTVMCWVVLMKLPSINPLLKSIKTSVA